jgi:hypothetical protein
MSTSRSLVLPADYTVFKSPLRDFRAAVAAANMQQQVRYRRHGETYTFAVPGA